MKPSIRRLATALIVTAMVAVSLSSCRTGPVPRPDASSGWEPIAAEQGVGRQERDEEGLLPIITIVAQAPGLATEEIEALVAMPIESQVNGAPGVWCVRSASRQGRCRVWADLAPKTNVFEARQHLAERLKRADLPPNVRPMLAPISFRERELLLIGLRLAAEPETAGERTSNGMDLHTLAEHVLRKRLLALPGVSQVVVTGGIRKQIQVELDPERLIMFGVTLPQIEEALKKNNTVGAGGNLRRGDQELPVVVRAKSTSLQDLEATPVAEHDGVPVRIKDVARVRFGGADRLGDGAIRAQESAGARDGPAVILTVLKEASTDNGQIDRLLSELQPVLPSNVRLECRTFTREDIGVSLNLPPGTGGVEKDRMCRRVEAALMEVPEIRSVWRRGGPGESAESLGLADGPVMFVALRTKAERGRESIVADIRERIARIPGLGADLGPPVSQYLGCAGLYAQIAVKLFGHDLHDLQRIAREIRDRMRAVPGVTDLRIEPGGDSPQLQIHVDRNQAARFGVPVADLSMMVEMGLRGLVVGEVLHEGRNLDLVVMYEEELDRNPHAIRGLPVKTAGGESIPLENLARIVLTGGPGTVYRENMQRRIVISCNVQGRDRTAVLTDIREALESAEEKFPDGYRLEYAGRASASGSRR
jgi:Cu/Ag efflux pump CusA